MEGIPTIPEPATETAAERSAETRGNVKVTREDWLYLAASVLVEHGVSQVKVLTLANRLEVSRSSFYWYFQSRKDLLDQLLDRWEGQNTKAILDHAARPAGNICRAVMHLFECFIDPRHFDPRLDFAVREWARRSPDVRARLDTADEVPDDVMLFYRRVGWSEEMLARYRKRGFNAFSKFVAEIPRGVRRISDGEAIEIGGRTWRVIVGRGHSPESGLSITSSSPTKTRTLLSVLHLFSPLS